MLATALGATVLTAVPAVIAPHHAYADTCYEDGQTSCPDDPDGPGDPGGNPGDPSGDGDGTGSATGGFDMSEGNPGDSVPGLPKVIITGQRSIMPSSPADPGIPMSYGGGGSSGEQPGSRVYSKGKTWDEQQNCYRNSSNGVAKITETTTYTVTYQVSTNISATAAEVLTATLGTQLNTSIAKSYGVEVTLNPGQSWALNVQYQTVVYAITTQHLWSADTTEYVNVTMPTGVVTGRSC
ncbi:hypothetical protein GCM10009665_50550 [Kitasatospora nipponensis]|uniref:Uncharacterized protein n=1 Tax=Kitasatospora nipponensis TaxID=258049 RepID=A0ABN1WLM8_9ACTN